MKDALRAFGNLGRYGDDMLNCAGGCRGLGRWLAWAAVVLPWWGWTAEAGALDRDEVAIVAMRDSPASQELAEYYAHAREIPASRIFLLDGQPAADLSRDDWAARVRPAIVKWLDENKLRGQVRCLVTTYDVPFKIGAAVATVDSQRRLEQLAAERESRRQKLPMLLEQINSVQASEGTPAGDPLPPEASARDMTRLFETAFRAANERVAKVESAEDRRAAAAQLERLGVAVGGKTAVLQSLQVLLKQPQAPPELAGRFEFLRGELQGLLSGFNALSLLPERTERDRLILELLEKTNGLLGALLWIEEQQTLAQRGETFASFDSELSLVLWPDHPLLFWMPNLLHWRYQNNTGNNLFPTLMVARLEAPTLELCKKLVDTALETEKTGLSGKFYVDARGLAVNAKQRQPGSYADYDESLRHLAEVMQGQEQDVVLDNQDALFPADSCPDAALYCGWYSLSNYIGAFQWKPGSVAYHIASGEAHTLRDANSNVWCKRMLEEGVCATLGPTHEPYLGAFPRPDEFFPLLLSGKYTLAECYYRTLPFNSWVMVLVGDPLYNPYGSHPAFDISKLPADTKPIFGP
ncbi:MAG: TIGR03790 family protein [Pirellulales bacterium]